MDDIRQRSWFGRNWPWIIPVGGCLTVIVLIVLGIGAAIFGVTKAMSGSEPYQYAVEQAISHPDVKTLLGTPVETNGIMQGNISVKSGGSGQVDIKIPLKGSIGEGSVAIVGEKIEGEWVYEKLYVYIQDTDEEINLLDKALEGN